MKKLNVSKKLLMGVCVAEVIIFAIGLSNIVGLKSNYENTATAIDNYGIPLNSAIIVVGTIQAMRSEVQSLAINTGNKDEVLMGRKRLDYLCKELEEGAESFGKTIIRPDVKAMYDDAMRAYNEIFKPGAYKLADDSENGIPQAELMIRLSDFRPAAERITYDMVAAANVKAELLAAAAENGRKNPEDVAAIVGLVALYRSESIVISKQDDL